MTAGRRCPARRSGVVGRIARALAPLLLGALVSVAGLGAQGVVGGAQERPPETGAPTVGLVLSGGAAKGLAHVGAIRVLEEAGLPVDVVTGTSMGAIVGGLYAIGYTPAMMDSVLRALDWTALLTDASPRSALDIERRLEAGETLVSLPIEGGAIRLPSGVIEGQRVLELLARLTWPVHGVGDFAELPRGFATVVMDLRTGEAVRLTGGSLPLAIRASMSIPALFEPVVLDGRTYVDGGLARNLPATDAIALGADVLVCVDVSEPRPTDEDFSPGSLLDVVLRTALLRAEASTREQRRHCDVLIEPDVQDLGVFAFDQVGEWSRRGYAAAAAQRERIEALADRLGRPRPSALPRPEIEPVRLVEVSVTGGSPAGERLVRQRLGLRSPRDVTAREVTDAIERVYGSGEFSLVSFRAVPVAGRDAPGGSPVDGSPELESRRLLVQVKERRRDLLGFGFRYDSRERAALLFDLSLRNRISYGSTTRLALRLGRETQVGIDYFDRIGLNAPTGVGGGLQLTRVPVDLVAGEERASVRGELDVYSASLYASWAIANAAFLRIGLTGEHLRAEPEVGADTLAGIPLETVETTFHGLQAQLLADTRDETLLPSRGLRIFLKAEFSGEVIGSAATFEHYVADVEAYVPAGSRFTAFGRLALTRGRGADLPVSRTTFVGGLYPPAVLPGRFLPLSGARPQEFIGRNGQLARLGLRWTPRPDVFLEVAGDAGTAGDDWTLDVDEVRFGLALTAGLVTPIGPVALTFAGDEPDDLPTVGLRLGPDF